MRFLLLLLFSLHRDMICMALQTDPWGDFTPNHTHIPQPGCSCQPAAHQEQCWGCPMGVQHLPKRCSANRGGLLVQDGNPTAAGSGANTGAADQEGLHSHYVSPWKHASSFSHGKARIIGFSLAKQQIPDLQKAPVLLKGATATDTNQRW